MQESGYALEDAMKKHKAGHTAGRRGFLKGVAAGGASALTALFASRLIAADSGGTALKKTTGTTASRGYHETEHIRNYYRTLRT
jgi:hypothetical protein